MEQVLGTLKRINAGIIVVAAVLLMCGVGVAMAQGDHGDAPKSEQHEDDGKSIMPEDSRAMLGCWAFMAAALATGIGSVAAGYAVSNVGTAAMGAVAEKPELMGKSLIYVALAEGIAIYGLLIAIIVLAKV
jgi:V/A-type H+-transporting ATPase subunit K